MKRYRPLMMIAGLITACVLLVCLVLVVRLIRAPGRIAQTTPTVSLGELSTPPVELGTPTPQLAPGTPIPGTPPIAAGTPVIGSTTNGTRLLGAAIPETQILQLCPYLQQVNAKFTRVSIPWGIIEPSKGNFDWSRADKVIDADRSCGLAVVAYLYSRSPWATQPIPAGTAQAQGYSSSTFPKNIDDYYQFVFTLAQHYKGRISRYAIENEATATAEYASSPQSYATLLATAYKAIHAADPNAVVESAPFSSTMLGLLVANDMWNHGQHDQAVTFVHHYFAHYYPYSTAVFQTAAKSDANQVSSILNNPEIQRGVQFADVILSSQANFDVMGLHYYGPWDDLQTVTDYIHANLRARGGDKPFDFWEFGYGWVGAPGNGYDPNVEAQEMPKLFATAMGAGGLWLEKFELNDADMYEGHPGLFDNQGTPRVTATTFKVMAQKLNGATQVSRLPLANGVWGYRFVTPSGTVFVLWSSQSSKVSLPGAAGKVTITDIHGNTSAGDPSNLQLTTSPIFVQ